MKTMGVLGGLGPQATMDFEQRVHRVSQERIPPRFGGGYPPMVVYYCRFPPIALDEQGQVVLPVRPNPLLLEAARKLGELADFLVVTANGPHRFKDELESASGLPMVSMIEATLADVEARGWQEVGVLGLGEPTVYLERLEQMDIAQVTIDAASQEELDKAIFKVMEGRAGEAERAAAQESVQTLRAAGVEGTILGCTEIPLLLPDADEAADLINPGQLLAEAAVKHSLM